MDPHFITTAEWAMTGQLLRFFWGLLLFIISFAGNLLLALSFIPSLVGTGHLPKSALSIRPVLFVIAAGSIVMAAYLFYRMVQLHTVFGIIYPTRWWY